jgi:hypothetical protein
MSEQDRLAWAPGDIEFVDANSPAPPPFADSSRRRAVRIDAEHRAMGPAARGHLQNLIDYYMKKPHPFTECVRDNTKRFGEDGAKRVCAVLKDMGEGTTKWRK